MEQAKKLFDFYSKQEVAENFSLDELLTFARQRSLQEWFAGNFYASEARKMAAAINDDSSDAELKLLLCKIFNLPLENLSTDELEEISAVVEKNNRRRLFMNKLPDDDRKVEFVETQGELVRALKEEARLIYLYDGEFQIPLNQRGVTYIGCKNAVVDFDEDFDIDLDAAEIVLKNLQVYLRRPITLQAAGSKNLKILDGSKKTLNPRPTLQEIANVLRGRRSFEPPKDFQTRAEEIQGVAVGETLLEEKNYQFDAAQFQFQPRWDFEYISILKNFALKKFFSAKILPHDAETLYINERKLQIFADFTCRDGRLTISKLYFAAKTLGIVTVEAVLQTENVSFESSGAGGYGLEIISDYPSR